MGNTLVFCPQEQQKVSLPVASKPKGKKNASFFCLPEKIAPNFYAVAR